MRATLIQICALLFQKSSIELRLVYFWFSAPKEHQGGRQTAVTAESCTERVERSGAELEIQVRSLGSPAAFRSTFRYQPT